MSTELTIICIFIVFLLVMGFRTMDLKNLIKSKDKFLLLPFLLIFLAAVAGAVAGLIHWFTY